MDFVVKTVKCITIQFGKLMEIYFLEISVFDNQFYFSPTHSSVYNAVIRPPAGNDLELNDIQRSCLNHTTNVILHHRKLRIQALNSRYN